MSPDHIKPQALTKRKGFRSRKQDAMTAAERQRKYRAKLGFRHFNGALPPDVAAGLLYIKSQWGMRTDREAVEAALRFLVLCTRQGLTRLPQSIDD